MGTELGPDSCQLSGLSVLCLSQSQSEGKHSPGFVSCYLPPHEAKSICMTCFDAPGDPDVVTIVSICPIVTRIDQSVVIFTPHMSLWSVQTSPDSGVGVRGHSVGVSRASVVLFPDSNITPTLRHPAINPTLGGDWRRHGERAET